MNTKNMHLYFHPATLIELVRMRPCLWDKTSPLYKDKSSKRRAWSEIYQFLKDDYAELDPQQRQAVGEYITARWTNLRDAFVRSLKKKPGHPSAKPYVYYNNMSFLISTVVHKDEDGSISDPVTIKSDEYLDFQFQLDEGQQDDVASTSAEEQVAANNTSGYKRKFESDDGIETTQTDSFNKSMYQIDEDEAFFISIVSSVRAMTEDEKLDFRMGVLHLIQDIKKRRSAQTAYSHQHLQDS